MTFPHRFSEMTVASCLENYLFDSIFREASPVKLLGW